MKNRRRAAHCTTERLPAILLSDPRQAQEAALKDAARGQVGIFRSATNLNKFHTRKLPPNLQALIAAPADTDVASRWAGPYIDEGKVPLDPWDHEFDYKVPGTHSKDGYDVWSVGPDGKDGTADDIGNWN